MVLNTYQKSSQGELFPEYGSGYNCLLFKIAHEYQNVKLAWSKDIDIKRKLLAECFYKFSDEGSESVSKMADRKIGRLFNIMWGESLERGDKDLVSLVR